MKKYFPNLIFWSVLGIFLSAFLALAQIPNMGPGVPNAPPPTPSGVLPFTPQQVINISDYGAVCNWNGSTGTDDTTAINAALAAARVQITTGKTILTGPGLGKKCLVTGPTNWTLLNQAGRFEAKDIYLYGKFAYKGPIGTFGTITGGSGGTPGTYTNVPLTGGTGASATANIVVGAGNSVTSVTITAVANSGTGFTVGDSISAASGNIGNTSGFSVPVASLGGGPIIDGSGARWMSLHNISVEGDCTSIPNIGIQEGVGVSGISADRNYFDNVTITGCYQFAGLYNMGSETSQHSHLTILNNTTLSTPVYGLVLDGSDHWNAYSSFLATSLVPDTAGSFNEDLFESLDVRGTAASTGFVPIWVTKVNRHKFISSYAATWGTYGFVIYNFDNTVTTSFLTADIHFETTALTDIFYFDGPYATPQVIGLSYSDQAPQASNSLIKANSTITSATITDIDINSGANVKLFDTPSLWTFGGQVYLPSLTYWNRNNGTFAGRVCLASNCWFEGQSNLNLGSSFSLPLQGALNLNGEFAIDQVQEGASILNNAANQLIVDRWRINVAGGNNLSKMTFQRITTSTPPAKYNYWMSITTSSTNTPAANQWLTFLTNVEIPLNYNMQWATANAMPLFVEFWATANNAGTYPFYCYNSNGGHSYVTSFALLANTTTYVSMAIPGDTGGSALVGTSLACGFPLGNGATQQTASLNVWQAGVYFTGSSFLSMITTSSANLKLAGFHIKTGQYSSPYMPRSYPEEIALAQRFYQKSFSAGTKPAQSVGVNTGEFQFPSSLTTSGTVKSPQVIFRSIMAGSPTVTFYNPAASNAYIRDETGSGDSATPAVSSNVTVNGFNVSANAYTSGAANDTYGVHWSADTGL